MANEIRVRSSLAILKGSLYYQSFPSQFLADLESTKGPSPGAVTISISGTDIDLSQLQLPGYCFLQNLEDPDSTTNSYVEYGVYEPELNIFYPFGELLPGESTIFKFSRNFQEEWASIGTGTGTATQNNTFRMKAYGDNAVVRVDAFDV